MLDEFGIIDMPAPSSEADSGNGRIGVYPVMLCRNGNPVIARFFSPDPFVQAPGFSQSYNRYSYTMNNPLVYTDPSGELVWFVPVIAGAIIGGYLGGAIQQGSGGLPGGNYNPFGGKGGKWDNTAWRGITVGSIVGAGVGLGLTSLAATWSSSIVTGYNYTGATTLLWDVTSNAIITGNINIVSHALQGSNWKQTAISGLTGIGAGAIGGLAGNIANGNPHFAFTRRINSIQNYTTNTILGASDRFFTSKQLGLDNSSAFKNMIAGAIEGSLSALLVNSPTRNFQHSIAKLGENAIVGRYLSSALSTSITSIPGASFFAAKLYLTEVLPYYTPNGLGFGVEMAIPGLFANWGLGYFQSLLLPNYPYANRFLTPNTWNK
jgi:RHS repeat-associated protein